MKLKLYTDGGSRKNPGEAGIGIYITKENGEEVEKKYKYLGIKTNNEAEYMGAYFGIKRCIELGAKEIDLYMDSDLAIKQLLGKWKIKKEELKKLNNNIKKMVKENDIKINFNWIPREENKEADRLSNLAMDKKI